MNPVSVEIITPLQMIYAGGGLYRLSSDFSFRVRFSDCSSRLFTVEKDFLTDLHSVPLFIRILFPRIMRSYVHGMNQSAVGHDKFYRFHKVLGISREFADKIYLLLAVDEIKNLPDMERVLKTQAAGLMYRMVRRFGWLAFGKGDGTPPKRIAKAMKGLRL
jgi:hypothetical protein